MADERKLNEQPSINKNYYYYYYYYKLIGGETLTILPRNEVL